jgi:hypothetical protein
VRELVEHEILTMPVAPAPARVPPRQHDRPAQVALAEAMSRPNIVPFRIDA